MVILGPIFVTRFQSCSLESLCTLKSALFLGLFLLGFVGELICNGAMSLLEGLLEFDVRRRFTVEQALTDSWISEI